MGSPEIVIIETTPMHIHELAEAMDAITKTTAEKRGLSPKKALWMSYRESIICMTALINGSVAAIWGIGGDMLTEIGKPWLVLSPDVEDHPFRTAFRYRKELDKFQKMFPVLEEYVDASNVKAIRMLNLMGFKVSENEICLGEAKLRRAERRAG